MSQKQNDWSIAGAEIDIGSRSLLQRLSRAYKNNLLCVMCMMQVNVWGFLYCKLEGKYSLESTDPRESEIRAHLRPYIFSVE